MGHIAVEERAHDPSSKIHEQSFVSFVWQDFERFLRCLDLLGNVMSYSDLRLLGVRGVYIVV